MIKMWNIFYCFLEYTIFKRWFNTIAINVVTNEYKCLCCNKNYQHKFDRKIMERIFNIYKFPNHNNNKFILLLQKGVYTYEYLNGWGKFN